MNTLPDIPAAASLSRVRPATAADLPRLAAWLARAVALPAAAHEHLLVAEGADGELRATLRLRAAIGLVLPRVSYHVGCTAHAAPELGLFHRQRTLLLGNDHTGASELADIAWRGDDETALTEQAAALRLLVHSALLLLACERAHCAARLIAELPGLRDSAGQSPFWQGLGRHFYGGDPADAAARLGPDWRCHVAALMPRQAVYVSFLPPAAAAAIAQVAPAARLLAEVLEGAGLRYGHHVNVEDGGPLLEAETDLLPGVAAARAWDAAAGNPAPGSPACLLLAGEGARLRALRAPAEEAGGHLRLAAASLARLGAQAGDRLWAAPLAP